MSNIFDWPKNNAKLKLVRIYKKHRFLWDPSLPGYNISESRLAAYKSMIKEMKPTKMTVEDLESKIKHLRGWYLQIQKKQIYMGAPETDYQRGLAWLQEMKDIMKVHDHKFDINMTFLQWPEKYLLKFIEIYKKHRVLWDNTLPEYLNLKEREKAYRAIIEEMNFPSETTTETVRLKIRLLRNRYHRVVNKNIPNNEEMPRWVQEMKNIMDQYIQMSKIFYWPERDLLKFIQLYKTHRILWDASTPGYRDWHKSRNAYASIAKQMEFTKQMSINEVQKRINELKCWYYIKTKNKQVDPLKNKWYRDIKDVMGGCSQNEAVDDDDDDVIICNDEDDDVIIGNDEDNDVIMSNKDDNLISCSNNDDNNVNNYRIPNTFMTNKLYECLVQTRNPIESATTKNMCLTVMKDEGIIRQDADVSKKRKLNTMQMIDEVKPTEDISINENITLDCNKTNNDGTVMPSQKEERVESPINAKSFGKSIINDDTSLTGMKEEPVNRDVLSDGCSDLLPKDIENNIDIKVETRSSEITSLDDKHTPTNENSTLNENSVEELQIFAKYVVDQLKTFPLSVSRILQMEIQTIIEQKQMEMCDN